MQTNGLICALDFSGACQLLLPTIALDFFLNTWVQETVGRWAHWPFTICFSASARHWNNQRCSILLIISTRVRSEGYLSNLKASWIKWLRLLLCCTSLLGAHSWWYILNLIITSFTIWSKVWPYWTPFHSHQFLLQHTSCLVPSTNMMTIYGDSDNKA